MPDYEQFEMHPQDDLLPHHDENEFEIGILKPHNTAARNAFEELVQGLKYIPDKLQRNIRAKLSYRGNDDSAAGVSYEGHFAISFYRDDNGGGQFECTIGRGHSKLGETRGVSHLVISPGQEPRGVMPQHGTIRFDPECGMLAIFPLSKNVPVIVFKGNGLKTIYLGEKYLIEDLMTLFTIGESEYILSLHKLNDYGFRKYKWLRDRAFDRAGLPRPDERIQPLPTRQSFNRTGSTIVHQIINKGGSADIWSGVNAVTGKVVAVKRMVITETAHLAFCREEVKINLNFAVSSTVPAYQRVC